MKRRHIKNQLLRMGSTQFLKDMSKDFKDVNGEYSTFGNYFEAWADSLDGNQREEFESERAPFVLDSIVHQLKQDKEIANKIKDDLDILQYIADNWEKMKGEYLWS